MKGEFATGVDGSRHFGRVRMDLPTGHRRVLEEKTYLGFRLPSIENDDSSEEPGLYPSMQRRQQGHAGTVRKDHNRYV